MEKLGNINSFRKLIMVNIFPGLVFLISGSFLFYGNLIEMELLVSFLMNIIIFVISSVIIRRSFELPNKKFTLIFFTNSVIRVFFVIILLLLGILVLRFNNLKYTLALMFFYFYSSGFEIYFFFKLKKLVNIK